MYRNTLTKKSFLTSVAVALVAALPVVGAAAQLMEAKEHAAEISQANFGNAPTTNGLIFVKRCDQCSQLGVTFNAQTQYFDGQRAITAAAAEQLTARGATVLFDPASRYISRVIFWPASD